MTNEEWRNHPHYKLDPLSEIQPALLNSEDIKHYIDKGCLIESKNFDPERLKPASYEMRLLGSLYDWQETRDGRLQPRCRAIRNGCTVNLPKNSISYLWTEEKLLLPEYIGARFNLHIRYVHKGILLGTGPLVDPGFGGSLLVPLHNLTDNDYELKGGEGVIWVEFTKLSGNEYWTNQGMTRPDFLVSFPKAKDLDDPDLYFKKSRVTDAGGIQSAFKGALDSAQRKAREAQKDVRWVKSIGLAAAIIGTLAILGSIAGLWYSGQNMITRVTILTQDSYNEIVNVHIRKQDDRIDKLENELNLIRESVSSDSSRANSRDE